MSVQDERKVNPEAEHGLIGGMIADHRRIRNICRNVNAFDFNDSRLGLMFSIIVGMSLVSGCISKRSLISNLKKVGGVAIDWRELVGKCEESIVSTIYIDTYSEIVQEKSALRRLDGIEMEAKQ